MSVPLPATFSDSVAGYVTAYDRATDRLTLRTSGGRSYQVQLKATTYAQLVRNLGDPYQDSTGQLRDMLVAGRYLYVYGSFYADEAGATFEAQYLMFVGRGQGEFVFERPDWWVRQIRELAEFYTLAQFGEGEIDYRNYRTTIRLTGEKPADNYRQETDTISRLVYGLASAYLLTGEDRFLEGAEKGTEYLREHFRFFDTDENIVYWYHGIDVHGRREDKVFASEFGDDYDAIPAYEQIYALAGPIQTYRITGDPRILKDAELTVDLFDRFYLGGPDSLRGFEYREVGPISEREPIGGNSYGFASLEYSIKVADPLRLAIFYDWGFVNADDFDFNPGSYNDNWGVGIRLLVLGNPLRLDFGIPITSSSNRDENGNIIFNNDRGNQFNFSFGTRF